MLVCRSASTLTVRQPQQPRSAVGGALTERGSTPLDILAAYGRPPDFGTYYTPVTFHSDDRTERCLKRKKNRTSSQHTPTKRILIALLFIYATKRMGEHFVLELPEGSVV